MRTISILVVAAAIAGLAWAQPFGPNEGRGPVGQATQVQAKVHVRADGYCIGAQTMTRTGRGEGGQAMLQRQLKAADGQHARGPMGGGQRRADRN